MDRALQTSLNLGFNSQVMHALEDESRNLRTLRDLDPARRDLYRRQFEQVEELRQVYSRPELVKEKVLGSLKTYFAIGVVATLLLAVALAAFMSRSIARAYSTAFREVIAQRERVAYLEEMASWQALARMLAHEIRNPLTPIEMLITSLRQAHARMPADDPAVGAQGPHRLHQGQRDLTRARARTPTRPSSTSARRSTAPTPSSRN